MMIPLTCDTTTLESKRRFTYLIDYRNITWVNQDQLIFEKNLIF